VYAVYANSASGRTISAAEAFSALFTVYAAGLLVDGLTTSPFCLPLPALLDGPRPGAEQSSSVPGDQQQQAPAPAISSDRPDYHSPHQEQHDSGPGLQAPPSSLLKAAVAGFAKGFWGAAGEIDNTRNSQQQQQQQQHATGILGPTEAGYLAWGANFEAYVTMIRYMCSATIAITSPFEALLGSSEAKGYLHVALLTVNALPYIINYRRPKVMLARC